MPMTKRHRMEVFVNDQEFSDKQICQRRMASSGILRRVALDRTDVSEELSASFIRVTIIGELGTTLAVTSNRRTLVTASVVSSSPRR
jgi:hypothetical protein